MNNSKLTCYVHRHMTFAEYGLYTHLREVSHKSIPQYTYKFNDRTLADRFAQERGCSKDTVNRLRRALARKGFISWLEPQKHDGGRYVARLGRILDHKEWAKRHPNKCIHDALEGDDSPVSNTPAHQSQVDSHQSHLEAHQSQIEPSPVSNTGAHQSQQRDISIHKNKSIETTPFLIPIVSAEILKKETSPSLDSANLQTHFPASLKSATGDGVPVSGTRQVGNPFGLEQRDGGWFTEQGAPVSPGDVAMLFGNEAIA